MYPEFIAPFLSSDRQGIWLVPTAEFRGRALRERGWSIEGSSDRDRARANKPARDALLTDHVGRSAQVLGLRVIDVDGMRSLVDVTAAVEEHRAPLLRHLIRDATPHRRADEVLRRTLVASFRASSRPVPTGTSCSIAPRLGTGSPRSSRVC